MSTQLNMASPAAATPVSASTLSSATSPTASSGGHSEFAVQQFRPAQHPSPLGQSAVRFVSDHESVLLDPQRYDPAEQEMDAAAPLGGLSVVDEQPHVVTSLDDHATALPIPIQVPVTNADIVDSTMGTPTAHHLSPSGDHTLLPDHVRHQLHELARKQQKVQLAGPRRKLFFKPEQVTAAMVTCGGVCPGLNNVIRALVNVMWYRYGVRRILGIRHGFAGLVPGYRFAPMELHPELVKDSHQFGGTMLGTSRGPQDPKLMVDFMVASKINVLFCIGGDGTQRGALVLANEITRRGLQISIIGIGKTIDNDLLYVDRSFGFDTAVQHAQQAIITCHEEARSTANGIGIVKLMGRDSGAIALYASLASGDVNVVLLPEIKFTMDRLITYLMDRFKTRDHCLIVCAEGAGMDLLGESGKRDASGNKVFEDIGLFLKKEISARFKAASVEHTIKYIDPSYSIRAGVTNASDSVLCTVYAQMAVHAAMAGKTSMMVGLINGHFVHIPLEKVAQGKKNVDIKGLYWQAFCDATGTPFTQ